MDTASYDLKVLSVFNKVKNLKHSRKNAFIVEMLQLFFNLTKPSEETTGKKQQKADNYVR